MSKHIHLMALLSILTFTPICAFSQKPFVSEENYRKYIEPLLSEKEFGTHYVEDGAADASVLTPFERSSTYHHDRPSDPVINIVRLGPKSLPVLIECLNDGRLTNVQFDGNTITKLMKVPVGYVCLDILMNSVRGQPIWEPGCASDGLGACISEGFYFRPDDYWQCRETMHRCLIRPWVKVVQRNWKRQYIQNRLRFHNFYDGIGIPEYEEFSTPKKQSRPVDPATSRSARRKMPTEKNQAEPGQ